MNKQSREHIIKLLDKGVRLDGRKPLEYRKISVEYDASKSAEGSARVMIGETDVITGVKMEMFQPYPDAPDKGSLMVGAELSPLASPDFETGPPSIEAIEIGRVIDRGIRESHSLDFGKMCVKEGEKAWMTIIDICPINADGNLFDAGSLSALAAIKVAKLPEVDGENINYEKKTDEGLPLTDEPVSVTVWKIGKHLIVDPTRAEEEACDARLTVATIKDGTLCAMQKGGESPISTEDIIKMVEIAIEKCDELRKAL